MAWKNVTPLVLISSDCPSSLYPFLSLQINNTTNLEFGFIRLRRENANYKQCHTHMHEKQLAYSLFIVHSLRFDT